jgi:hypothetical protein
MHSRPENELFATTQTETDSTLWYNQSYWERVQKCLLSENTDFKQLSFKNFESLGFYDLVYVITDESSRPLLFDINGVESIFCFTETSIPLRLNDPLRLKLGMDGQVNILTEKRRLKHFMLGDLCQEFANSKTPMPIFINPMEMIKADKIHFFAEEILFAPIWDELTKKHMMTDPSEALALLAINPEDQARFGIEVIFHMVTSQIAPEAGEERELFLKRKIRELSFLTPRVPIKQGSGSIYCVLLNLENPMEELAFIRQYNTFDPYSDVIFVMSNLELLTGNLSPITYNGEHIDTIFAPIINWQKKNNPYRRFAHRPAGLH